MLESEVRRLVSRYLSGLISVEELEHLLPDGWDLDEVGEDDARLATFHVMGAVAEFTAGDISEGDLRSRLEPFAAWTVTRTYSRSEDELVAPTTPETKQVFAAGRRLPVGSS